MTLAADAPTTDGRENPATDISRIVPSQDCMTFKSSNLKPEPGLPPEDREPRRGTFDPSQTPRLVSENRARTVGR